MSELYARHSPLLRSCLGRLGSPRSCEQRGQSNHHRVLCAGQNPTIKVSLPHSPTVPSYLLTTCCLHLRSDPDSPFWRTLGSTSGCRFTTWRASSLACS